MACPHLDQMPAIDPPLGHATGRGDALRFTEIVLRENAVPLFEVTDKPYGSLLQRGLEVRCPDTLDN
jgi:hypothetical protein